MICNNFLLKLIIILECEKCEEWFHYECLGFLGTELDASIIDFIC